MAVRRLRSCGPGPAGFAGLASPSLVFLNGTATLLSPPSDLGGALANRRVDLAFVNWKNRQVFEAAFRQHANEAPRMLGCVDGIDINGKGPTRLQIYARPERDAAPGCAPSEELRCRDKAEVRWRRVLDTPF
jgi:hypothetical protein